MSLDLSDEVQASLFARFGRNVPQGTVVFREGDAAEECFVLLTGRVRLLRRVRAAERTVAVLKPGDLFGESGLTEGATRAYTAVALDDLRALAIRDEGFPELLTTEPRFGARLFRDLVRRLRDAEDQLEIQALRDADSKVVSALLRAAAPEQVGLVVALSPLELSAKVGLDVDAVKRTIARLRAAQYLRITDEKLVLNDLESLRKLYGLLGVKEQLGSVDPS